MTSRVPSLQRRYPPSPLLNPSYTLSPFSHFPGGLPGIWPTFLRAFLFGARRSFSRFPVRPCLRAVAKHPAGAVRLLGQSAASRIAFAHNQGVSASGFGHFEATSRSLHYGPETHSPPQGWLCRMSHGSSVSLLSVIPSYRALAFALVGYTLPLNEPSFRVAPDL